LLRTCNMSWLCETRAAVCRSDPIYVDSKSRKNDSGTVAWSFWNKRRRRAPRHAYFRYDSAVSHSAQVIILRVTRCITPFSAEIRSRALVRRDGRRTPTVRRFIGRPAGRLRTRARARSAFKLDGRNFFEPLISTVLIRNNDSTPV